MKVENLIETLSGAHCSAYVESVWKERGGIMLVGPPASLKTAVSEVLDNYPTVELLSDLTVKQGVRLRDDIAANKIQTLAFTDFAKLYQRMSAGWQNVEGFIRALTAEGFRRANWEDSRIVVTPARALVVGCMTQAFCARRFGDWIDDGFARRFLWCHIRLKNPNSIIEAIIRNARIDFGANGHGFSAKIPTGRIRDITTETEARELSYMLRHQQSKEVGLILLRKTLSALKWKFPKERDKPFSIVRDFAQGLSKEGAELEL